ncbi:M949_RS01915 family surface polysaccharide biosynthesis protein [Leeia sp.]|uniref:M949_RS01915 family surface polysaccharide biosynthesis protein n=1 Tax=Leeia sp. TaxID=2884678 RepID=UPI0035B43BBA
MPHALQRLPLLLLLATTLLLTACPARQEVSDSAAPASDTRSQPAASQAAAAVIPASAPITAAVSLVDLKTLPAGVKLPGKLLQAWHWTDADGEQWLLRSHSKRNYTFEEMDATESLLHVAQFRVKDGKMERLWLLQDGVKDCPFDSVARFYPDGVSITDLDQDGVHEVTMAYHTTCTSDVSPQDMKVILREREGKWGLRGSTWLPDEAMQGKTPPPVPQAAACPPGTDLSKMDPQHWHTGCYQSEQDFASAPPAFLQHAKARWRAALLASAPGGQPDLSAVDEGED